MSACKISTYGVRQSTFHELQSQHVMVQACQSIGLLQVFDPVNYSLQGSLIALQCFAKIMAVAAFLNRIRKF